MPITALGTLAGPLAALADMLAALASFQSWTGTASSALALGRIYLVDQPAADSVRPFAIIGYAEWKTRRAGFAGGVLRLGFEASPSDTELSDRDAAIEFLNDAGAIVRELHEAAEGGGLLLNESTIEWGPHRSKNEADDYLSIGFLVRYGLVNLP